MKWIAKIWSDEKGEDMTEYALIVGLVALAVIGGAIALGTNFNTWYTNLASYVGGLPVGTGTP